MHVAPPCPRCCLFKELDVCGGLFGGDQKGRRRRSAGRGLQHRHGFRDHQHRADEKDPRHCQQTPKTVRRTQFVLQIANCTEGATATLVTKKA